MKDKNIIRNFICIMIIFLLVSCGGSSTGSTEPQNDLEWGWYYYQSENYTEAINSFNDYLDENNSSYRAYVGLGWTYIRKNDLINAKNNFEIVINLEFEDHEFLLMNNIGLAGCYVLSNNKTALESNSIIIFLEQNKTNKNDGWQHKYDPSINSVNIHNLLAEIYLMYQNFGSVNDEVNSNTAWGQVKKSLELDSDNTKAKKIKEFLDNKKNLNLKEFLSDLNKTNLVR